MPKVAAVVITYNRKTLLEKCIKALLCQSVSCDIIIIDNASTDGTGEMVRTIVDPRRSYFNTGSNLGGAGGFNYGMRKAVEAGYEYVWLMDDDTIVQPDSLAHLLVADKKLDGNYGWLSSKALWTDGSLCLMNQQRTSIYRKFDPMNSGIEKIQLASFVSLFMKSEIILQHGLPIKDFFIWGDDWEYTRRISRWHPCYFIPQSVVTHAMAGNLPNNLANTQPERIDRFAFLFRNEWVLFRKEGIKGWFYYFAKCNLNFWRIIFKAPDKKFKRIKSLLKGVYHGLFFWPKIEYINKDK